MDVFHTDNGNCRSYRNCMSLCICVFIVSCLLSAFLIDFPNVSYFAPPAVVDFDFVFLPNFPSLSLRTTLSANTFDFELEGEIHNATEASYEFDDLQFDDSNIILSGNNANMTLATFAQNN